MSKWELVNLEDVCEILDSQRVPVTASNRKRGIYPYYGANGVQDYVSDYIFDDELVLLAEDGGNFGSKTKPIAYRVSGKCWVNNHAHVLKAKSMLDTDYLCYSIMFYDVSKIISGTTRAKLTQSAMRKMKIPLPPLETQKHIVKTLDTAAELLAMRKQQLVELDNLIKSIFYDMFGDPFENPKGWTKSSLSELAMIIMGQSPNGNSYNEKGLGIPLLNGPTEFGDKYPKEKQWTLEPTKMCKPGDILFCVRGATAGKLNIADKEYCIGRGLAAIRPKRLGTQGFIYQYLNMMYDHFQSTSNGSTFINIGKDQLNNLPVLNVSTNIQEEFTRIATKIEAQKSLVQKAIDETQYLFDSLMSEYFD